MEHFSRISIKYFTLLAIFVQKQNSNLNILEVRKLFEVSIKQIPLDFWDNL
jgi:hypothetical protein